MARTGDLVPDARVQLEDSGRSHNGCGTLFRRRGSDPSLLGQGSSEQSGQSPALVQAALEFINNQPGGLQGLVRQFQEKGAGDIISSWIGTGQNQTIAPEQLQQVLGDGAIGQIAQKAGISSDQISGLLSQVLPHVIDKATPSGEVPQGGLNAASVLGALGGLFGGQQQQG
jgi:uncharacterized protein YidB (DUF937 family)